MAALQLVLPSNQSCSFRYLLRDGTVPETTHLESSLSREEARAKKKVKATVLMNHTSSTALLYGRRPLNYSYILIVESPEDCDRYEEKTEKSPLHVEPLDSVSKNLSSVGQPCIKTEGCAYRDSVKVIREARKN